MSANPPNARVSMSLRRAWQRMRRFLGASYRRWVWRPSPAVDQYLASLEQPLLADLVLWLGDGKGLRAAWAEVRAGSGNGKLTHVLALQTPAALQGFETCRRIAPGGREQSDLLARAAHVLTDRPFPLWALRREGQTLTCLLPQGTANDAREHSLRHATSSQIDGRGIEPITGGQFVFPASVPPSRPRLLIFGGGLRNNGITSSLINLTEALVEDGVDVDLVTDAQSPEAEANLGRVSPGVQVIRSSARPLRRAEMQDLQQFRQGWSFGDANQATRIDAIFRREARRILGAHNYDAAVDFSGYSPEWSLLIAAVTARRHVIWQHNDMQAEFVSRFANLQGVFAAYRRFDAIASVSEETRQANFAQLGAYYSGEDQAITVRNLIRPAYLRQRAAETLPSAFHRPTAGPVFVTVGRLSPEKAQHRIIEAIAQLAGDGIDAGLVVIGSGPDEAALKQLAQTLGIAGRVAFLGQLDNPFPVIAACDCLVLASDREGQPMVLLEALTLGIPVIGTDIAGCRSVLGGLAGPVLVPPSHEGVLQGLRQFLDGKVQTAAFDAEAYRLSALADFRTNLLGLAPAGNQGDLKGHG